MQWLALEAGDAATWGSTVVTFGMACFALVQGVGQKRDLRRQNELQSEASQLQRRQIETAERRTLVMEQLLAQLTAAAGRRPRRPPSGRPSHMPGGTGRRHGLPPLSPAPPPIRRRTSPGGTSPRGDLFRRPGPRGPTERQHRRPRRTSLPPRTPTSSSPLRSSPAPSPSGGPPPCTTSRPRRIPRRGPRVSRRRCPSVPAPPGHSGGWSTWAGTDTRCAISAPPHSPASASTPRTSPASCGACRRTRWCGRARPSNS